MSYVDDNFGNWDMRDEDDMSFYHRVQAESVYKRCQGCGAIKKLLPQYGYCDGCATKKEQGWDFDDVDIPDPKVDLELQLRITEDKVEKEIKRQAEIAYYEEVGDGN